MAANSQRRIDAYFTRPQQYFIVELIAQFTAPLKARVEALEQALAAVKQEQQQQQQAVMPEEDTFLSNLSDIDLDPFH